MNSIQKRNNLSRRSRDLYLETKRRKMTNPSYKPSVITPNGIILNEGDYYLLRNGQIGYLFDQTVFCSPHPFYIRERGSHEFLAQIGFDGNEFDFCNSNHDIIGVYDRPSLTFEI